MNLTPFLDELEKISKEKKKGQSWPEAIGAGVGTAAASVLTPAIARRTVLPKLLRGTGATGDIKLSPADLEKLKKSLASKVTIFPSPYAGNAAHYPKGGMFGKGGLLSAIANPGYKAEEVKVVGKLFDISESEAKRVISKGGIFANRRRMPEIIAHELGHAAGHDPKRTPKILRALFRAPRLVALAAPVVGGVMAAQDPDSVTAKLAPVGALAMNAPLLADEAAASLRGYKAVKNLGTYGPKTLKLMRNNMLRAFGTYGAAAAAATLPVALIAAIRSSGEKK